MTNQETKAERRERLRKERQERDQRDRDQWLAELFAWERGEGGDIPPSVRPNEFDEELRSVVSHYATYAIDRHCGPLTLGASAEEMRESMNNRIAWMKENQAGLEDQLLRKIIWAISTFKYEAPRD